MSRWVIVYRTDEEREEGGAGCCQNLESKPIEKTPVLGLFETEIYVRMTWASWIDGNILASHRARASCNFRPSTKHRGFTAQPSIET